MKNTTNWPSRKELNRVLKKLEKVPGSRGLPLNPSSTDLIKYELCRAFVSYLLKNDMKQSELAKKLNIATSDMSEILRYRYDSYSIDRLVKLLEILDKKVRIKIA